MMQAMQAMQTDAASGQIDDRSLAMGYRESQAAAGAGTLTAVILEDGAVSLNGRQYPPETVERLLQHTQEDLADPDALPITCYVNHAAADEDDALRLCGRVVAIWREGTKILARIALAPTQAGRELAALSAGGYLRSVSIRASGCELQPSPSGPPLVVEKPGERCCIRGVDFTASPGLADVARIVSVDPAPVSAVPVLAGAEGQRGEKILTESFSCSWDQGVIRMQQDSCEEMREDTIEPLVRGTSPGMNDSPTTGDYARRMMELPPTADPYGGAHPALEAHRTVHDHVAAVLDSALAPMHGQQEAVRGAGCALLQEAGRVLAQRHVERLVKAHDESAKVLGYECHECYKEALATARKQQANEPDSDDQMEQQRKTMTIEEAQRLLAEAGYRIERPKTREEQLLSQLEAQSKQLDLLREQVERLTAASARPSGPRVPAWWAGTSHPGRTSGAMTGAGAEEDPRPRRKSLVEGANTSPSLAREPIVYRNGDYLRERYDQIEWSRLVDRSYPLPEWINIDWLVNELAQAACAAAEERLMFS